MATDILVKIGADITDFSRKMAESNRALSNFSRANKDTFGAFERVGSTLTKWVTTPALAATTALTGVTLVKGFGRLLGIDTARAKLSALGHDADGVEQIMENALEAVKGTSFGMDEAATAAASAVAAGIKPGKELARYLGIAGDAAAIAGTDFSEMGSIFNKVQTAQRAYTGDLNMLADRGIPIYQWLAEEAGKTAEDIRDMASEGKVSSKMFLDAIEKNIGGAAKEMGEKSFAAALKNIGSDIARIGANFLDAGGDAGGFFSTVKPLLSEFRGYLETLEVKASEFGKKFGDAFNNMVIKIRELKAWFDGLSPAMQGVVTKAALFGSAFLVALGPILKFVGFIPQLISGFSAIMTVIKGVGTAIGFLTSPIGLIIVAVVGLAYLIYKYWDEIKAFTIEAWGAIRDFFSELWTSIKETAIAAWEGIKTFFSELWTSITEIASTAWNAFITAIMMIIQPFIDQVMNVFNGMKDGLQTIWDGLKTYFSGVWELIKNIFLGAILLIINLVTGNFKELRSNTVKIFENIREALRNIWQGIQQVFFGALSAIWGGVRSAWSNIRSNTSAVFSAVRSIIQTVWGAIRKFFTETLRNMWNDLRQRFANMRDSARDRMNEARQNIVDAWNRAVEFLRSIDLAQIGRDVINGFIRGIRSRIGAVADAARDAADAVTGKIKSILGIASPSRVLAQIGRWTGEGLALGIEKTTGLVGRATAKLAEAATPEAPAISLAYDTPSGIRSSLASAVRGTVDVNARDDKLAGAIASLERKLDGLIVEMDGETVGRIVRPYVNDGNALDATVRRYFD